MSLGYSPIMFVFRPVRLHGQTDHFLPLSHSAPVCPVHCGPASVQAECSYSLFSLAAVVNYTPEQKHSRRLLLRFSATTQKKKGRASDGLIVLADLVITSWKSRKQWFSHLTPAAVMQSALDERRQSCSVNRSTVIGCLLAAMLCRAST